MRCSIAAGLLLISALAAQADEAVLPAYVHPTGVLDQIEHCRSLIDRGEDSTTLADCFRHARLILDEGIRIRAATPLRGEEFEARLTLGFSDLARRLAAFSVDDPERLNLEMRDFDASIRSFQVELSRLAAAERMRISLVSRGGVSLGNWQAGFLYLVTEWAKGRPGGQAFSTVTGASAGAVNGFAATIEGCKGPNLSSRDSLYYRAWMDLGLFGRKGKPGLFPTDGGSTALSLFTSDALDAVLEQALTYVKNGEHLPSCSVDFGFVATHLDPSESPVHVREDGTPILTTKKLKEKFSVRMNFSEAGLEIVNIGPTGAFAGDQVFFAGLGHEQDVALESLMLGVRASGAFPAAFPPVPLTYVEYLPGPGGTVLPKKRVATFIDGGLLDNTPVGLAVTLDAWRDATEEPLPRLAGLIPADPRTYVFLEPSVRSWVLGREDLAEAKATRAGLLGTFLGFARDLLGTSTDAQLTNTAEQFSFVRRQTRDWTQPRLSVPERHLPITGNQFDHFMAFLERDFRIFDFYVGMADGYTYLEREWCLLTGDGGKCDVEDSIGRLDHALQDLNPEYRCMRAYYASPTSRVLTRITTTDLPAECESLQQVVCDASAVRPDSEDAVHRFLQSGALVDPSAETDRCVEPAIANHNFRALLAGMHNYKVWMQSDSYDLTVELEHFFDELSNGKPSERFIYLDLPTYLGDDTGYSTPAEVKRGFRSLVEAAIDGLAEEQGFMGRHAIRLGGRAGADRALGKNRPRHIVGVGVVQNGLEVTWGRRLPNPNWRWDTTFRFFNVSNQNYGPGLEPLTGDFYLSTQATRLIALRKVVDFELGAGWVASETVAFDGPSTGHVTFRTGPRAYIGLTVLQQIFLTTSFDFFTKRYVDTSYRNTGTEVADDWEFNLSLGWRFTF